MSGSRKYTDIINPLAPFLSTGPAIGFTPQKFRWAITSDGDREVIKQTSAEPGVGTSALKVLSRPSCCRLIFCDPKDRAFLFSPKSYHLHAEHLHIESPGRFNVFNRQNYVVKTVDLHWALPQEKRCPNPRAKAA